MVNHVISSDTSGRHLGLDPTGDAPLKQRHGETPAATDIAQVRGPPGPRRVYVSGGADARRYSPPRIAALPMCRSPFGRIGAPVSISSDISRLIILPENFAGTELRGVD